MTHKNLLEKFCRDRNLSKSTIKGYESALLKYTRFHNCSLEKLLEEAIFEEDSQIPLKNRKLKMRLVDFRSFLLGSGVSPNTTKTYFSKIRTVYKHFEIEIPILPDVKYEKDYEINYLDLPTKKHIAQAVDISSIDLKAIILLTL